MALIRTLFFILLSISFLDASSKSIYKNSIELGASYGSFDGSIMVGKSGNNLDLKKDLGIKKYKSHLISILSSSFKNHKFGIKTSSYSYSGKIKLDKDIIYNSEKFAKGALAKSRYDLKWAKLSYRYLINEYISAGADINGIEIKSYLNNNRYKKRELIPSIAIDYNLPINKELRVLTKYSLTPYGKSRYSDFYGGVALNLGFKNCSCLNIGYQINSLHINTPSFKNDARYSGVYLAIKVGF